jgi:hypothetical protein
MAESKTIGVMSAVGSAPRRWLYNIISLQEKKKYSFYVILLFSFFVAITRFMLEFILCHQTLCLLNINMLNFTMFYLHTIFIYTLILRVFVPELHWKKAIHLVLIGVFLGIFPPVIDTFIYGIGNFMYAYSKVFPDDWRLLLYNEKINFTVGETATLFLTIFFTTVVVYIKTRKIFRTIAAFVATYCSVVFFSQILPTLAFSLSKIIRSNMVETQQDLGSVAGDFFSIGGFSNPYITPFFQFSVILIVYLILNPKIAKNILRRIHHALPAGITCLLGYSLHRRIDGYAVVIAIFFLFAFVVAIIQNDYFDRTEDEVEGRAPYVERDDVTFFTVMLFFLVAALVIAGNVTGYFLMLFAVVSMLYNYDFYRGKKYFPSNNKIEGIFGVSSFLGGLCMAFITGTKGAGDILNIENVAFLVKSGSFEQMLKSIREFWTLQYVVITFLVFGGWFLISILKDYKDIEGDTAAGNQTVYSMLKKKNRDVKLFHRIFSLVVFALLLIPPIWLIASGLETFFAVCIIVADAVFLFVLNMKDTKKAVMLGFIFLSIYLLCLVIGNHVMHQAG